VSGKWSPTSASTAFAYALLNTQPAGTYTVHDDRVDKGGHQEGVAEVGIEVEALRRQAGRAGQGKA
jgi:hypothetical protein